MGSARVHPVKYTIAPAASTPIDPIKSDITWTNTARIAIPPDLPSAVIQAEKALTTIPTIATAITPSPFTTSGWRRRPAASTQMKAPSSQRKRPLISAPRISARRYPKVLPAVAGRVAIHIVSRLRQIAVISVIRDFASDNNARLLVTHPAASSAKKYNEATASTT